MLAPLPNDYQQNLNTQVQQPLATNAVGTTAMPAVPGMETQGATGPGVQASDPTCPPGYIWRGDGCEPTHTDPPGGGTTQPNPDQCVHGVFDPYSGECKDPNTGQCYSQDGTTKIPCGGNPLPTPEDCPPGQYFDGTQCRYDNSNENPCGYGEVQNPQTGQCEPEQPDDQYGCPPGYQYVPSFGCVPGFGEGGNQPWQPVQPDCPPGWSYSDEQGCFNPNPNLGDHGNFPGSNNPDPGDPFDVGESPGSEGIGDPVNDTDPVNVAPSESFNYDEVQRHIDDAMANAERYLGPQEQMERERFQQELINKGIDPYSAAGQKALEQMQIGQNDRRSKAMFDAMSFGQGMQQQMWDQEAFETTNAKDLTELIANLGQRAHEFDITAGMTADEMNWGKIADVMGWNRQDFYDWRDENRWIDSLIMAMAGLTPPATFTGGTGSPYQFAAAAQG